MELLRFAISIQAPLLLNLANFELNKFVDKLDALSLKEMMLSNVWKYLPLKKPFFEAVGIMWSQIVASVPEKDRMLFKVKFLDEWDVSLKPNEDKAK
jgi:hypothetical protein